MMDDLREKVIKGMECAIVGVKSDEDCKKCPYQPYRFGKCKYDVMSDALSLLKAQEPIVPIKHLSTGQICGSCKKVLLRKYKYCPACGKEVKWDE